MARGGLPFLCCSRFSSTGPGQRRGRSRGCWRGSPLHPLALRASWSGGASGAASWGFPFPSLSNTVLFQKSFLLPDYMKGQPDITMDMRAILVDWMVEVQVRVGEGLQEEGWVAVGKESLVQGCCVVVPSG